MIEFQEGFHAYYIYIITNKAKTVLYIGVTNNLRLRLQQHSEKLNINAFTSKYNIHFLLHYEKFTWIQEAIVREKELKGWKRERKIELIKSVTFPIESNRYHSTDFAWLICLFLHDIQPCLVIFYFMYILHHSFFCD